MTTEKRLAVAIWQSPAFRGSREDARRIARDVLAQTHDAPDLFAGMRFDCAEPTRNHQTPQLELFA